jgi:hypothetical protein
MRSQPFFAITLQVRRPMTFTTVSWYIEAETKTKEYQLLVVAKEAEEERLKFAGIKTALAPELGEYCRLRVCSSAVPIAIAGVDSQA